MSKHYFHYECDGLDVATCLEPEPGNDEGEAKLLATQRLEIPCPACGGDHGLDRITEERYVEINTEDEPVEDAPKPKVFITIEVTGIGCEGTPEEVGLVHADSNGNVFEDNTPVSAQALLDHIKAECGNDKGTFISDWDLSYDPRITIGVQVGDVRTYVDW